MNASSLVNGVIELVRNGIRLAPITMIRVKTQFSKSRDSWLK